MVFGLFGGGNNAAKRNARKQWESDINKWKYNWQKMQDNYDYQMDQHDYAVWNQQQSIDFKNETAKQDWIYREEMRRFDFNNQVAAYNSSLETYERQMDYNNMALEITSNDNTRKYNERLTAIGFQNEELLQKYGFDTRAQTKDVQAARAETSFKAQDMAIQALEGQGKLAAMGQTGRSARRNMQSALAAAGRQQSALADSIMRKEDQYQFGLERSFATATLSQRQLRESMMSAKDQFASDQTNAALQKYSADMAAESQIAPLPQEQPPLPKPLDLPVPKILEPQKPPSWEQYSTLEPIKGAVAGTSVIGQIGQIASTVASVAAAGAALFPSDDRLKYDINKVGKSKKGIPIYTFRYRTDGKHGPKYIGTSAQDLIAMGREDAVAQKEKDGFYSVDYSKLDVKMEVVTT